MEDIKIKFGERIRKLRNEIGISQEELSFRSGISQTYVGQLERGLKNPSLEIIEKIANGFDVDLSFLFYNLNNNKDGHSEVFEQISALLKPMSDEKLKNISQIIRIVNKCE